MIRMAPCRNVPSLIIARFGYRLGIERKFDTQYDALQITLYLCRTANMTGRTCGGNIMRHFLMALAIGVLVATPSVVSAQDHLPDKAGVAKAFGKQEYSPYAGREFPTRVLWGDTHLHTMVSVDAGTMTRLGQEDAFRFARGEEVTTTHGLRAKLSRPLDFLVVSDHAEMYGLMPQLLKGDP